jgi:DNA helicase-2/ATP-dependent DNA helicase PcrA
MGGDLRAGVLAIREARRATGRALPRFGIGSTLLLKGLEADHAMIQDATSLNARHLYVAMSRASRSLAVLSSSSLIGLAP